MSNVTVTDVDEVTSVQTTGDGAYLLEQLVGKELHGLSMRNTLFHLLCNS